MAKNSESSEVNSGELNSFKISKDRICFWMKRHFLLFLLVMTHFLLKESFQKQEKSQYNPIQGQKGPKKSPKWERDHGLIKLNQENFDEALKKFDYLVVLSYKASSCTEECHRFHEPFSEAAEKLWGYRKRVAFGLYLKEESEMGEEEGWLDMKLYIKRKEAGEFRGKPTNRSIVGWASELVDKDIDRKRGEL